MGRRNGEHPEPGTGSNSDGTYLQLNLFELENHRETEKLNTNQEGIEENSGAFSGAENVAEQEETVTYSAPASQQDPSALWEEAKPGNDISDDFHNIVRDNSGRMKTISVNPHITIDQAGENEDFYLSYWHKFAFHDPSLKRVLEVANRLAQEEEKQDIIELNNETIKTVTNSILLTPTPEEDISDDFSDINPAAIRQELEARGIVNGQLVDGAEPSPFVQQVMNDVAASQAEMPEDGTFTDESEARPRLFVTETSDEFTDPEDAFAIWDNENDKYYYEGDGIIRTFPDRESANDYLHKIVQDIAKKEEDEWMYTERGEAQAPDISSDSMTRSSDTTATSDIKKEAGEALLACTKDLTPEATAEWT